MAVSSKHKRKASVKDRKAMRFSVAHEQRTLTLITGPRQQSQAVVIDYSCTGLCLAVANEVELEQDQDVLVTDEQEVRICTVKRIDTDDDGTRVGLQVVRSFPIAKLPEKTRAQWGYNEEVAPFPIVAICLIACLFFLGMGIPVVVLNLGGVRNRLADWAEQPQWKVSPRDATTDSSAADSSESAGRSRTNTQQQTHASATQRRRSNVRPARSQPDQSARDKSVFTMDDALPGLSGSL